MRRLLLAVALAPTLLAAPAHAQVTLGRLFNTPDERAALDARRALAPPGGAQEGAAGPGQPGQPAQPAAIPGVPPGAPGSGSAATLPPGVPGAGGSPMLPPGVPGSGSSPMLPPGVPGAGGAPPMSAQMPYPGSAAMPTAPGMPGAAANGQTPYPGSAAVPAPGLPGAPASAQMPYPGSAAMSAAAGAAPGMQAAANGQAPYPGNGTAPAGGNPQAGAAPQQALTFNGMLRTSKGRSTVWLNNLPQSGSQQSLRAGAKALTVVLPSGRTIKLQPGQRYDLATGTIKDVNQQ